MKGIKFSYIILIILIGLLVYVTYLKFSYVEQKDETIINKTNSISLNEIANNYNNKETNADTNATINGTNLDILYNGKTYTFSYNNGILKLDTLEDNDTDNMFINLVDSVTMSKTIEENASIITTNLIINSLFSNDAVKVVKNNNNILYVIDTTKEFNLYNALNVYNEVKILNLNDKDYNILINDIELISPIITYNQETNSMDVIGLISNKENKNAIINIALYDKDKKKIKEENVNIKATDNTLKTSINLDNIKIDDLIYCSYDIKL